MPWTPLPFIVSLTVVVLIAWAAVGSQALPRVAGQSDRAAVRVRRRADQES
jgi:hypothetical protein